MSQHIVDILFAVTAILLAFNGLKNGALVSIISLLGLPIAFAVAYFFGPTLTVSLASSNIPATPLIAYAVLFVGTILIVQILASFIRNVVKKIPLIGPFDSLLGAVVGFVEAWAIWLIILIIIGTVLNDIHNGTGSFIHGIDLTQLFGHKDWHIQDWYTFYNDTVNHSLFAQVNNFFGQIIPTAPQPPQLAAK